MAVLLSWVLFGCWALIGLAALKLGRLRWSVPTLLLAPAVGFAALVIPLYILARFGVPVRLSAGPAGGALLAGALVVLWRARPSPVRVRGLWRGARPFAAVLIAVFGLTAWPLFGYGFAWVANGNDDMGNYCLIATGYRDHGYAGVPVLNELRDGRDQTQPFWFAYVIREARAGSEVLLAVSSAWSGHPVVDVFMPVLVALHLALVAAAGALAVTGTGRRGGGVLACALLGASGAATYGVVQQLIAQAAGLALLCAALALVTARFRRLPARVVGARAVVSGITFAGLLLFYPEVIPLLVGACVVLGLRDLARGRLDRRHLAHVGGAIAVMAALLPVYLVGCVSFMLIQVGAGTQSGDWLKEIFPYYLTPRGPALVWGLLPLAGPESELAQSAAIWGGLVLSAAVAVPLVGALRRGRATAALLAAAAALGASLLVTSGAFGLFKLAMFVQPFLWAVVAGWVVSRRTRWATGAAALAVAALAGLNARVQFWYVDQSRGRQVRVTLPVLSAREGLAEFRTEYARRLAAGEVDRVLLASDNVPLCKLLAAEVRGVPCGYVGVNPFDAHVRDVLPIAENTPLIRARPEWLEQVRRIRAAYEADGDGPTICDPDTGAPLHQLVQIPLDVGRPLEHTLVVAGGGAVSPLNRLWYPSSGPTVVCAPLAELHNFAVFCDASGARHHFLGMRDPDAVALHQLEEDPAFRKRTMAGVGRAMVLDVLNPAARVRVLVSVTASFKSDPATRLTPPVTVAGDRRVALGATGGGCARLVSPPLAPQAVGTGHYLALDFGATDRNPNRLAGAERLWGEHLLRDRRRLAGHLRDVSVLTDEEYAAFRPPQKVERFPDDLAHPHLEFSGVFEEGWVGRECKFRLTQPAGGHDAVVRGQIPQVGSDSGFRTEVTLLVDGVPVEKRVLGPGSFELRGPGGAAGPRWVTLRFSNEQVLPAPDGRHVVAHLQCVGFEPTPPVPEGATLPADSGRAKLDPTGVFVDGWCAQDFAVTCQPAGPGREAVVRGLIPELAGGAGHRTEVTLLVDGAEVARQAFGPGTFELRGPAGKSVQARRLECRFTNTQVLPPPDGRTVGARIQFIGFEPVRPSAPHGSGPEE